MIGMQFFLAVVDYQGARVQWQTVAKMMTINHEKYATLPCSQRLPRDRGAIANGCEDDGIQW
eukprot:10060811-Ditylum_brightwellii.AAC.1